MGAAATTPRHHKRWRDGTHRTLSPAETVANVERVFGDAGITRVADVTGLDNIGIPVVMVVRPNARSLSVSQGKGLDKTSARASGVMEALEVWRGEHVAPEETASWERLTACAPVIDVAALPRPTWSRFSPHVTLPWVRGRDLMGGGPLWLPLETVHLDYRVPRPSGTGHFHQTSNGLASGNCTVEATLHALCELIERDALTVFRARGLVQGDRRLDLATVDDRACRNALGRYDRAEVDVAVWDATSDVGIPCFLAAIADRRANPFRRVPPARGAGCHPDRDVALLRALTEAAQCRLTVIAGTRDDHLPSGYERLRDPATDVTVEHPHRRCAGRRRSIADVATFCHDTFEEDLDLVLGRLRWVGIQQVGLVELTPPSMPFSVVRAVAPGLEGMGDGQGYVSGRRAVGAGERS